MSIDLEKPGEAFGGTTEDLLLRRGRSSPRGGQRHDVPRFSLMASGGWIGSYSSVASIPAYFLDRQILFIFPILI